LVTKGPKLYTEVKVKVHHVEGEHNPRINNTIIITNGLHSSYSKLRVVTTPLLWDMDKMYGTTKGHVDI